jgi:hypothetical protein
MSTHDDHFLVSSWQGIVRPCVSSFCIGVTYAFLYISQVIFHLTLDLLYKCYERFCYHFARYAQRHARGKVWHLYVQSAGVKL